MRVSNGTYTLEVTHGELEALEQSLAYTIDTLLVDLDKDVHDPEELPRLKDMDRLLRPMFESVKQALLRAKDQE